MNTTNPQTPIVCAIHQPNLFPRFSTIAKLYASDIWVVLDDVQFNARDYQHRARLAPPTDPEQQQWLTLPVHRPHGRATKINDVCLVDIEKSSRRMTRLPQQLYGATSCYADIADITRNTAEMMSATPDLAAITEFSTLAILQALGWHGQVVRSSSFTVRADRSARLADLCLAANSDVYLCGTGGARYLKERPFHERGLRVRYFDPPVTPVPRRLTSLHSLAANGLELSCIQVHEARVTVRSAISLQPGRADSATH